MNSKLKYLFRSALHYFSAVCCPNCNGFNSKRIDRKYLVTRLFECQNCHLQFRHPADSKAFNEEFYQSDYEQDDGITTELPSAEVLRKMISSNFNNSPKNADPIIALWQSIFSDLNDVKAIDYGSSWGYMSYQFLKRGIKTQSFEISRPRATYGNRHLGLNIKSNTSDLETGNDLFYSSHVIEHVPSIGDMVNESKRLLKREGIFVAECPNGSAAFRKKNPFAFNQAWGLVHPSYLSEAFYQYIFKDCPYLILTSPYSYGRVKEWDGKSQFTGETDGDQLLVIAKPNIKIVK